MFYVIEYIWNNPLKVGTQRMTTRIFENYKEMVDAYDQYVAECEGGEWVIAYDGLSTDQSELREMYRYEA